MKTTRLRALRGREGFTLIELLVALGLLAILAQIAVPSLSGILAVSRTRQAAGQVAADLSYTRMLAIRTGRGATLIFTNPTHYRIKEGVGPGSEVRKVVDLKANFDRVTLVRPDGVDSVVFNARGIVSTAVPIGTGLFVTQTARNGQVEADTLQLRLLGHVQRYF